MDRSGEVSYRDGKSSFLGGSSSGDGSSKFQSSLSYPVDPTAPVPPAFFTPSLLAFLKKNREPLYVPVRGDGRGENEAPPPFCSRREKRRQGII